MIGPDNGPPCRQCACILYKNGNHYVRFYVCQTELLSLFTTFDNFAKRFYLCTLAFCTPNGVAFVVALKILCFITVSYTGGNGLFRQYACIEFLSASMHYIFLVIASA